MAKKMIQGMVGESLAVLGLGLALGAGTLPALAQESNEVVVSVSGAYIPNGFDSGSDAFAVVNGLFPNSCYEWKESRVAHPSATLHEVRSIARVKSGMCLMILMPFNHEVELGRLEKGQHTLRFMNGDGTYLEKNLTIN